jgi:hypothetical protein
VTFPPDQEAQANQEKEGKTYMIEDLFAFLYLLPIHLGEPGVEDIHVEGACGIDSARNDAPGRLPIFVSHEIRAVQQVLHLQPFRVYAHIERRRETLSNIITNSNLLISATSSPPFTSYLTRLTEKNGMNW